MSRHGKHHESRQDPPLEQEGDVPVRLDEVFGQRHVADVSLMINKHAGLKARAEISTGGLLSVAALVSTILLSTAVLVHVATNGPRRR